MIWKPNQDLGPVEKIKGLDDRAVMRRICEELIRMSQTAHPTINRSELDYAKAMLIKLNTVGAAFDLREK